MSRLHRVSDEEVRASQEKTCQELRPFRRLVARPSYGNATFGPKRVLFHRHRFFWSPIFSRRLPKLHPVTLGITNPSKPAILRILHLPSDFHPFSSKLDQYTIEILHPIVDHELLPTISEVRRVLREQGPDGMAETFPTLRTVPSEQCRILTRLHSKMVLVPF